MSSSYHVLLYTLHILQVSSVQTRKRTRSPIRYNFACDYRRVDTGTWLPVWILILSTNKIRFRVEHSVLKGEHGVFSEEFTSERKSLTKQFFTSSIFTVLFSPNIYNFLRTTRVLGGSRFQGGGPNFLKNQWMKLRVLVSKRRIKRKMWMHGSFWHLASLIDWVFYRVYSQTWDITNTGDGVQDSSLKHIRN